MALILLFVAAILLSGCVGSGQPDTNGTTVNAVTVTAPAGGYYAELGLGVADHSAGRDAFENGTTSWYDGDPASAMKSLQQADGDFSSASAHYRNMESMAVNASQQRFAGDLEASAEDMRQASEQFMMSINASLAGNDTAALAYFNRGQGLVNDSMDEANASLLILPSI